MSGEELEEKWAARRKFQCQQEEPVEWRVEEVCQSEDACGRVVVRVYFVIVRFDMHSLVVCRRGNGGGVRERSMRSSRDAVGEKCVDVFRGRR